MISSLAQTSSRQREIAEVVLRNGWGYMRRLLSGGKTDEPELPPPTVLRNILVDLGPVYVKFGQLLSTRPELLPPEYIEELSHLQANVPPVDWPEIETSLRQEIGQPLDNVFSRVERHPVAAGSIAQTHKATLKDGREVALKIQRPGLDRLVDRDIALIKSVADLVSGTEFGQYYDVVSLADEFANALEAELNFNKEASYTDQLRRNLSKSQWFDPDRLVVPEIVWPLTTNKLLVMQWLQGKPLLTAEIQPDANGSTDATRAEVTVLLFRAFLQQLYIDGFFHADPHPGNLFYLDDGRVALLDCGMSGRLDPRTQGTLIEIILAMVSQDSLRCTQLTMKLAQPVRPVNFVSLQNDYDRLLRKYYNLSLSEINFSEAFYEVLQAARRNHLRWPSNLGLYAKALANLEGVAREFYPKINLLDEIQPLLRDLLQRQLLGDEPMRSLLRTGLELRNLSMQTPRQLDFLLERMSTESLKWNLTLSDLDGVRRTLDDSANRLSFSIVVGSLIVGAAIIFSKEQTTQLFWVSNALFWAASLLGIWLIVSILRSGRLK